MIDDANKDETGFAPIDDISRILRYYDTACLVFIAAKSIVIRLDLRCRAAAGLRAYERYAWH